MGTKKCCVGGCNATSETHRLFSFPKNDELRNLWMSFLVPTNSLLIGLSKEQLLRKRVCEKHFDKYQFDHDGRRLRFSYPCLLTHKEIAHGVPLCVAGWNVTLEHNYSKEQDEEGADPSTLITITGRNNTVEHDYFKGQDENNVTKSTVVTGSAADSLHSGEDNSTMATTAEVVEFIDKLFDSVNGSKAGKLRRAVKEDSPHHTFWVDSIKKLKSLHYVDSSSKHALQLGKPRLVKVPSLQGWITTLESFLRISKLLFNKYGVVYYYPRRINQDPLENFFGHLRALNSRNVNPDPNTFIYAFKSLLITNLLSPYSKYANCEEDEGNSIVNIKCLFENVHVCTCNGVGHQTFVEISSH